MGRIMIGHLFNDNPGKPDWITVSGIVILHLIRFANISILYCSFAGVLNS